MAVGWNVDMGSRNERVHDTTLDVRRRYLSVVDEKMKPRINGRVEVIKIEMLKGIKGRT